MSFSVLSFCQIRDLVSNLGWRDQNNVYVRNFNCLKVLEKLETALQNEDVVNRNVRLALHICDTVTNDLVPIIIYEKDPKIRAIGIRILVSLSMPVECLLPIEDIRNDTKSQNVRKKLILCTFTIKKAFLDACATLSLVSMMREAMIRAEKHSNALEKEECIHLKNCLVLLRNLLHIPEDAKSSKESRLCLTHWLAVQKKLIWNIFVQGIDGALLMMLNSKYRTHWTEPLAFIIAQIYRNQNVSKIHQALGMISSPSDSSEDDEGSDGSKNSSASMSSEPSKVINTSDSGYPVSDSSLNKSEDNSVNNNEMDSSEKLTACCNDSTICYNGIQTKLQKVQLSEEDEASTNQVSPPPAPPKNVFFGKTKHRISSKSNYDQNENYPESSSSSESPLHKKIKGNCFSKDSAKVELTDDDTVLSMSLGGSSADFRDKSSEENFPDRKANKNSKLHKMRSAQNQPKILESDSSNEDLIKNTKHRNHPPVFWRGKSPRRSNGCIPSICLDSANLVSSKRRFRYPLLEKRNSMLTLLDETALAPSDDDLRNVLKEFTMSFMHSGFSQLIMDIKKLIIEESFETIDKSLFFWIFNYFVHLAAAVHLNYDHLSDILSIDIISFLVHECVATSENMELHSKTNVKLAKYIAVHLSLIVAALKEVLHVIDIYSKKITSQREKIFFNYLCGMLAGLKDLRLIPLLLLQNCPITNMKRYLEDVVSINHQIITLSERNNELCWGPRRVDTLEHLKLFSTPTIMKCYGKLLQNFRTNSSMVNECIFTMFHHIAGDVNSSHLLLDPSILKSFSDLLQNDVELDHYQEDLIIYILNKFALQKKRLMVGETIDEPGNTEEREPSESSSSSSCDDSDDLLNEDDDELLWWFLQFEQDKDPVSRISEHTSISKQDILSKLQFKGIITSEKRKKFEETMKVCNELNQEKELTQVPDFDENIPTLLRTLVQAGSRKHLIWLQDILLETCYAKLGFDYLVPDCIVCCSTKLRVAVPLVPYTEDQKLILQDETFLQLLQKLGFHLSSGVYQMYPRIPIHWSSRMLFTIAARLGPIKKDKLKFDFDDLMQANDTPEPIKFQSNPCPTLPPLSSYCTRSSWLTAVQQSKENYRAYKLNIESI
ncbi:protein timeless-like isoform X2 [Uloborus diversus]|uniref:protein timeless-like isoform X2 n=1 Tax=Uloborus diversus TaxID=327109 RepID=UPI00240996FB|nr:protein timeless-like isoform X2 [Uloborus diversus]